MDKFYYAGVFAGIAIALAIFVIVSLLRKKKAAPAEYDERQQLARGKAYAAGYTTASLYLCAYGILDGLGIVWCEPLVGCIIGVMLSATVVSLSAIKNDAFLTLTENIRSHRLVNGALTLAMVLLFVTELLEGKKLIADGKLTECASSLLIAIFWSVILVAEFVHSRKAKKLESEEDEA